MPALGARVLRWRLVGCRLGPRVALLVALSMAVDAPSAAAQSVERVFSGANEAFFQGDYAQAIQGYERLLAAGIEDADVYFNLAAAYARSDQLGRAVLNYERVLWLSPGDEAAEADLKVAHDLLGNRRAEREGEAMVRARPPLSEALVRPFSLELLAWLVLALDVLFFGLLLVRPRLSSETARLSVAIALPLLGALWLTTAAALAVKSELFRSGEAAVVLREGAELREGPDRRAQVRGRASEGQSARLLAREGDFARVRLPGGVSGWLNQSDLGRIQPN